MNAFATSILGLYALGTIVALSIIVVLIIRRVKTKNKEDFEKRDN